MIKIFTLGAVTWTVEINDDRLNDRGAFGTCFFDESKIMLQKVSRGDKRTPEAMEQSLHHEVVHAILDTMHEYDLSKNEKFVQGFSVLLHQFNVTKK